jgi:hypothetical protein
MDSMCIELSLLSSSREHGPSAGGYVDSWLGSNPLFDQVATVYHITYLRCQLYATSPILGVNCMPQPTATSPILGVNYTWHLTIAGPTISHQAQKTPKIYRDIL